MYEFIVVLYWLFDGVYIVDDVLIGMIELFVVVMCIIFNFEW